MNVRPMCQVCGRRMHHRSEDPEDGFACFECADRAARRGDPMAPLSELVPALARLASCDACPACGSAIVANANDCGSCADAAADATQARIATRMALRGALESVPQRFRGLGFDHPLVRTKVKNAGALAAFRRIDLRGVVTLLGASGVGKSLTAAAAFGERVARFGPQSRWLATVDLAEAAETMRLGAPPPALLQAAVDAPLLILDDLGAEDRTEPVAAKLRRLLWRRHDGDGARATVVTSGLSADQISSRYGDAMARRLLEEGAAVAIDMSPTAPSRRLEAVR